MHTSYITKAHIFKFLEALSPTFAGLLRGPATKQGQIWTERGFDGNKQIMGFDGFADQ